ncbi:MAG: hypothetical protein ACKVQW_14720 [Pyrinomonadaceae bacterium]
MQRMTLMADRPRRGVPFKSVILLTPLEDGTAEAGIYYEKKRKRRVSKRWRSIDKVIRRLGSAQRTAASDFLDRHDRSNKKKKNGGLRNLIKNFSRSQRKGRKKLKLRFL